MFGARQTLPVILQIEVAECALACLTMIAVFHGHDVDLPALRRRFPVSLKGANLLRLIDIAQRLGLQSRPLRVEMEYLPQLKTPCVLHWDMNHFVVLKAVTSRGLHLHDPARGAYVASLREVSERFTGIALELTPANDFAPVKQRERISLRRLAGRVVGLPKALAQVAALALALEVCALSAPLYLQWVLDQVLVSADISLLNLIALGFLLAVGVQSGLSAARGWAISGIGAALSAQWTTNLFSHLLRLPLEYFAKRNSGDLISRFHSLQTIQQTLTGSFVESILDGVTASLTLALLAMYSPLLTGVVLLGFAIYAGLRWVSYQRLQSTKEEQLTYLARQQTQLLESIRGVQTIKLANQQGERQARMANAITEVANRDVIVQRIGFAFGALGQAVFGAQRVLVIWLAAHMVLQGIFSAGMLVVFIVYADQFATRMRSLVDKWVEFRLLQLHAMRIADIALAEPEQHGQSSYIGPAPEPSIEVHNLSFRYAEDEPWIVKDASFRIEAHESVALIGPSGCGKTTLVKLLLGLLEPTQGCIRIGGIDIRKYGLDAYRSRFGAVMQEDELFSGSIADNISFFDPGALLSKIESAAGLAEIHDDIVEMPMGYETLVGDMGSALSGGQKQRILLARALYRAPSILLLDEATSHLDVERECAINAAVRALKVTRLIIAHRPETIASADRALLVRGGQVVAMRTAAAPGSAEVSAMHSEHALL
ncbi:MAG: peptidase domain-containing ABC transporter [Dokdonella sp.]